MTLSLRGAVGAAVLAAALSAAAPAAAAPSTLLVDDDRQDCKRAPFTSINAAVQAAEPGDTVRVCAGRYDERVVVAKPLTVEGARRGDAAAPGRDDDSREAVVVNDGDGAFEIDGSGVTVQGFTVQGVPSSAQFPAAGMQVDGSGHRILDTIFRGNSLGVMFTSDGPAETELAGNLFADNNLPAGGNVNRGGIFGAFGPVENVHIHHNTFRGQRSFAINLGGLGGQQSTGLEIDHNESFDEGTFLVVGRQRGAEVHHNRATELRGSGVFSFGEVDDLVVEHNEFLGSEANTNSGVNAGLPAFGATRGTTGLVVGHNEIRNFAFRGVRLQSSTGFLVEHNRISDNTMSGIILENADDGVIEHNDSTANGKDGVELSSLAEGNRVEDNDLRGNAEHDCHDDSAGPGSGGTANLWEGNRGLTQNRPGLCEDATVTP